MQHMTLKKKDEQQINRDLGEAEAIPAKTKVRAQGSE
jgi:hypothetical protein